MATNIYHITPLKNLSSVLEEGEIFSHNILRLQQVSSCSIAHPHIQDRRADKIVPCSRGGNLHDYVPFYFAPRSPMLYAIHGKKVSSYQEGQSTIIHLVSTAEAISAHGADFTFTDGHAAMAYADFHTDIKKLEAVIDRDVMQSKYWFDTNDDPNRKFRRQAEFLVYASLPVSLITEVGVCNSEIKEQVEQIFVGTNHRPLVQIHSDWYY